MLRKIGKKVLKKRLKKIYIYIVKRLKKNIAIVFLTLPMITILYNNTTMSLVILSIAMGEVASVPF